MNFDDQPSLTLSTVQQGDSPFTFLRLPKETTLERDDFTLQLLMFVTAEKERLSVYSFLSLSLHFLSAVVPAVLS